MGGQPHHPARVIELGEAKLRTAGLSSAKARYVLNLAQALTSKQLPLDDFEVARVDHRSRKPGTEAPPASVDEWVSVFKQKRDEVVNNRCKS